MLLYSSRDSLLNTNKCPTGTVSSNASSVGLQCVHHDAEKYATKGIPAYIDELCVVLFSSTKLKSGKEGVSPTGSGIMVCAESMGVVHPAKRKQTKKVKPKIFISTHPCALFCSMFGVINGVF